MLNNSAYIKKAKQERRTEIAYTVVAFIMFTTVLAIVYLAAVSNG